MADGIDNGVEARGRLAEHGRELADQGGEEMGAPEAAHHGHGGVGTPGQKPQANVGDGHLGNPDLGAVGIFIL